MAAAVQVAPEILDTWPDYMAVVVIAGRVRNGPSDEVSERLLADSERTMRESGLVRPADDPRIAAWRSAFSEFGAKPSRYPSSAESLVGRVLKGRSLPRVNALVDTYNAVSLRHVVPVGGEDLDRLEGISASSAPPATRHSTAQTARRGRGRSSGATTSA